MSDPRLLPVDLDERRRLLGADPRTWRRWLVAQARGLELARCEAALSMARPEHDDDPYWRERGWSHLLIERRAAGRPEVAWRAQFVDWARDDDAMPLP